MRINLLLIFGSLCGKIKFMRKEMIKKIRCAVLCALLTLSLCSCSVKEPEPVTEPPETTSNVVRITFPEGTAISQAAMLLEENGVCSAAEFMAAADDPTVLEGLPFIIEDYENRPFIFEGYVFPDTYEFYRGENARTALKRFLKNADKKLDESVKLRCDELGYTVDEILTLASIIQEEAGNPAEMGKVSSVIHNRLESSRFPKLQCDVATFYLRDYVKPYFDAAEYEGFIDLYNTYNCEGLPEGPITNPGLDAINAALYPEETDYYYFVTDSESNYYYASTWSEHLENCDIAGL